MTSLDVARVDGKDKAGLVTLWMLGRSIALGVAPWLSREGV